MRKSIAHVLFLILFFNLACCPSCDQWKLAVIKANCPPSTYIKVYLPACNTFNGLEAQFICCNDQADFYLNAITLLLPCYGSDPDHAEVSFLIGDQEYVFLAERLLGGQRLLLPEEAKELAIEQLLAGNDIHVSAGRYQTVLTCEGFAKVYKRQLQN